MQAPVTPSVVGFSPTPSLVESPATNAGAAAMIAGEPAMAALYAATCGAGGGADNVDMDRMCGAPGTAVCARPDERISWDGVHLTQHAYRVMTDLLYHKGFASPAPVEFQRP